MAKSKYYVVWEGHQPGIYHTWAECQAQIHHFPNAKYKSFATDAEAKQAYIQGWKKSFQAAQSLGSHAQRDLLSTTQENNSQGAKLAIDIDWDSISVDVGCSGNPGIVEYKGVDTRTGEVLFYHGPIGKGTNNLGEFLAIVHALAYLKAQRSERTIYTDSVTALSWIRQKKVATNLVRDESTEEIWTLVERALDWLHQNSYRNQVIKWDTQKHGEIKADFGRK